MEKSREKEKERGRINARYKYRRDDLNEQWAKRFLYFEAEVDQQRAILQGECDREMNLLHSAWNAELATLQAKQEEVYE